ncbi:MAG: tetratricopeptide repeat protein [Acidobacteriota bacterium]|nr:tetratricopeptide repeat protein [Acidobacteriota bacterium]
METRAPRSIHDLLIAGGLVLIVGIAYAVLPGGDFILFDTNFYITDNPHVSGGLSWQNIAWAFTSFEIANWHPLTWISHMIDVSLFGLNPAGHLLHNMVLHAANTVLLFLLLRHATGSRWRSALVAALFAVHPLNVENVAWAAQRKSLLAMFWGLTSIWLYLASAQTRRRGFYMGSVVCFALSLMAKPMLVTMPFLLILLDFWPLNRLTLSKLDYRELLSRAVQKVPFFLLSLASSVIAYLAQAGSGAVKSETIAGLTTRLGNALLSYVRYSADLIYPDKLGVHYQNLFETPPTLHWLGALGLLAAVSLVVTFRFKHRPVLFVGWFWFVGTLVPVIGLVQLGEITHADRYTYFPAIGLFCALAFCLPKPRTQMQRTLSAVATLSILALLTYKTHTQAGLWHNSETLFTHTLRVTPFNPVIYNNLGTHLMSQGRYSRAEAMFQQALKQRDTYLTAYRNLSRSQLRQGKCDRARDTLRNILARHEAFIGAWLDLSQVYVEMQDIEGARRALERVVDLEPENIPAWLQLAELMGTERIDEALFYLETAMTGNPRQPLLLRQYAAFLSFDGETGRAVAALQTALKEAPDLPGAHLLMGNLYAKANNYRAAKEQFRRELEVDPNNWEAMHTLGMTLITEGDSRRGISMLRKAVEVDPSREVSYLELGRAYFNVNDLKRAERFLGNYLTMSPNDVGALVLRANAALGLEKPLRALEYYDRAVALKPDSPNLLVAKGEVFLFQKKVAEAATMFRRALELDPKWAPAHFGLAQAAEENPETARTHIAEAMKLAKAAGDKEMMKKLETFLAELAPR